MESTVHAPWLTAPATRTVIGALTAEGADVRFVGGCVRDALLGRESDDIDIGTPDPPERVLAMLQSAGIETRTVPRGVAHGTVTALAGGERYEITTLRRDERTDGRHAEVAFTDDWREDAARRDFTINAMSATPDGALHDYFGGQADLEAGHVRFVGDPATRIAEDHLRILRFFRFHAWYGKGEPDADGLEACREAIHTIRRLFDERVQGVRAQSEMMKLLAATDPMPAVRAMRDTGVLAQLLPESTVTKRLARLVQIERNREEHDSVRRLTALIEGADADAPNRITARWRLNNADSARLAALAGPPSPLTPNLDLAAQDRLLYRSGRKRFRDLVMLAWSAEMEGESEAVWQAMLERAEEWDPPEFPLTGADVLARCIPEGPEVGRLLNEIEEWWIDQEEWPGREVTLKRLDDLVAKRPKE